ncbi:MAG: alpha/beta fold hydrolase [Verrucomicrobiales bacterium]
MKFIFLHGGVGMAADWDGIRAALPCPSEAIDLWSFLAAGPCSLAEAGERLVAASSPGDVLVGYSMGGRLALHALAAAPGHWSRAVLVSTHPGLKREEERLARCENDRVWAERARSLPWPEFLAKWNGQSVLAGDRELVWGDRLSLENQRQAVARSFEDWSLGCQGDFRPFLRSCQTPLSWLVGKKDEKFSGLAQELQSITQVIDYQLIENSGHRIPWEKKADFSSCLKKICENL